MRNIRGTFLVVATACGAALGLWIFDALATRHRLIHELELLRERNLEIVRLRSGNALLSQSVSRLEAQRKALAAAEASREESARALEAGLKNAGGRTVREAFESYLWALYNQDPAALAQRLVLTKKSQTRLDALFDELPEAEQAKYGDAEEMFALLYLSQHPVYFSAVAVTSAEPAPDEDFAKPTVQYEYPNGRVTTHTDVPMRRTADGWDVMISDGQVSQALRALESVPAPR